MVLQKKNKKKPKKKKQSMSKVLNSCNKDKF